MVIKGNWKPRRPSPIEPPGRRTPGPLLARASSPGCDLLVGADARVSKLVLFRSGLGEGTGASSLATGVGACESSGWYVPVEAVENILAEPTWWFSVDMDKGVGDRPFLPRRACLMVAPSKGASFSSLSPRYSARSGEGNRPLCSIELDPPSDD